MKKILLVSENQDDKRFAESIAGLVKTSLVVVPKIGAAEVDLHNNDYAAAVFNLDTLDSLEKITQTFTSLVTNRVHAIISPDHPGNTDLVLKSGRFGHVIIRKYGNEPDGPEETGRHYANLIKYTLSDEQESVKGFLPADCEVTSQSISHSTQKRFIAAGIVKILTSRGWQPKMSGAVANAVDELLMNAIYDAPVNSNGEQMYATLSRSSPIQLDDASKVKIDIAFSGCYLGITVTDQNGSLDRSRLLNHIAKNYNSGQNEMNPEHIKGAGLGLALILKSGGSLCFSCAPGKSTEATVLFKKTASSVAFRNQFQYISVRSIESK